MYERSTSVRLARTIFATQSMVSATQIAIFTLASIMAVELAGTDTVAGLPSTVLTTTQALLALPMGLLMGRIGRRLGLSLSYSFNTIGTVLAIVAITQGWFWVFIASAALLGAGRSGSDQSRFAAGELFPENERARWIGFVVFAGAVGAIGGPMLVAPSSQVALALGLDENTGPWLFGLGLSLLAVLTTFFLLRPEPMSIAHAIAAGEKAKREETGIFHKLRPVRELLQVPTIQLAVLAMLISQVVMVTLMTITPLHMNHHDHSKGAISLVISAHTLGMFGFSSLTGYLIDRYGRVPMMIAGAVLLILSALIAPLSATMPFLVTGLFLLGLGWNFGYIAGSSLLADALQGAERARMQGTNDMLVAAAAALGSLSSGILYSSGGYISVAGVGIALVVLFLWMLRLLAVPQVRVQGAD